MSPLHPGPLFEVCVDSPAAARAAEEGGADRIELCAALSEGGLTPSAGCVEATRACFARELVVLIRPRAGDFLYSELELDVMKRDLAACRAAGADGVALGVLRADGGVDRERTRELVELARPLAVTFHRAFDMCRDPLEALEDLASLGIERVLTSGGERTAVEGIGLLRRLVEAAGSRISVVAGGGVREDNVARVLRETRVRELHFTARVEVASPMRHRNPRCRMSSSAPPGEYESRVTEADLVRRIRAAAGAH